MTAALRLAVAASSALALASSFAAAGPLPRKGATDAYPVKALVAFAKGLTAERMGDPGWALGAYNDSLRESAEANTHFNIARLSLEVEDRAAALEHFKKYLELAPKASDRAAIEKIIAELTAAKTTITIGASGGNDAADAVILVDGEPVGRSPVVLTLAPGDHFFERVSSYNYTFGYRTVYPGRSKYEELGGPHKLAKGNVVIAFTRSSTNHHEDAWDEGGHTFQVDKLFALPVGTYRTRLRDNPTTRLCKPIEIKVPSVDTVTYVRVTFHDDERRDKTKDCYMADVSTRQLDTRAP